MRGLVRSAVLAAVIASAAGAQATSFRGRVLSDSSDRPVAEAIVEIEQLKRTTTTDSLGRFVLDGIPAGTYYVSARRIGFEPAGTRVQFLSGTPTDAEFVLKTNAQTLAGVTVVATAPVRGKLGEFEERRLAGAGGRFLTQAQLEKRENSLLSDILRQVPGLNLVRGGSEMYVAAGRMSVPGCALCGAPRGAPPPCFAAVMIDGAQVYGGGVPRFNINSINAMQLAGVEYYAGGASMPVKYNATRETCGLLLLWTK